MPARRLIQAFEDQTTLISNANPPATLPKLKHRIFDLFDGNTLIYVSGEETIFSVRTYSDVRAEVSNPSNDPYLEYYLGGDANAADSLKISVFTFADDKLFIAFPLAPTTGVDPLSAITSAELRPYATYRPIDTIPADPANTTYEATMTLAPTNADHDASFIPSFNTETPGSQMQIASRDSRGWYFNDIESDTPNTICKILARWYQDVAWVWRIYGYYSQLVAARETASWIPESNDPRLHTWTDPSKDHDDVSAAVDRPPYPSLDALKAAIPLPELQLYFKSSASGLVMKTAVHDIHNPVRSKLVQIPDTHYNTPPRVTQLPTNARENELFQLVSDQYRPDSDHTWTFEPGKATIGNRTVMGASLANVISSVQGLLGRISESQPSDLPIVFQNGAVRAIVAYSDDPEHLYFYIHNGLVSTSDIITIEMHGERSDGSPIIKTGTFRYSRASGNDRVFQARVSGAYGALDLSDKFSISIKRGNTYLYMNTGNNPATAEWQTGLLHTAGLYKGKADGSFVESVIVEKTLFDAIVATSRVLIREATPDNNIGNSGNWWFDASRGIMYRKSDAGVWTKVTDLALESELSRANVWTSIPVDTAIPANYLSSHDGKYMVLKGRIQKRMEVDRQVKIQLIGLNYRLTQPIDILNWQ